jgi:transcription initiation factor TFIIB
MSLSSPVGLLQESAKCEECRGALLFSEDTGEQVCRICGTVSDLPNDLSSNLPTYVSSVTNSTSREYPTSTMMYDLNLPTVIDIRNFDANGRRIQASHELNQLRRWNNYTISGGLGRSNQVKAMRDIDQIVRSVGLPASVTREACEIYLRRLKKGVVRSRSITSMAAAAVLVACNLVGATFPTEEIERLKKTPSGKFIRYYHKQLLREMNMRVTSVNPSRDVSRIAGKAGISGRVERKSLEVLSQVKDNSMLAGKRPASLAAAALYVASIEMGERANQMHLAFAAGVTPITLRKRSTEISLILKNHANSSGKV